MVRKGAVAGNGDRDGNNLKARQKNKSVATINSWSRFYKKGWCNTILLLHEQMSKWLHKSRILPKSKNSECSRVICSSGPLIPQAIHFLKRHFL